MESAAKKVFLQHSLLTFNLKKEAFVRPFVSLPFGASTFARLKTLMLFLYQSDVFLKMDHSRSLFHLFLSFLGTVQISTI